MRVSALALTMILALAACARPSFDGIANIYPANAEANKSGAFSITYKDVGLSGPVSFSTRGESFQGSYTTISNVVSSNQWGSTFSILDAGLAGNAVALSSSSQRITISPGHLPGRLDAFGSRGTSIQCEYLINRASRSGTGACQASTGALYRLHFSVVR